jgi:hypothetical protein
VNIDQLMDSLSDNAPDPDHVLASFGRKRRARRNRMYAASGGLAVAVVAILVGVLLHGANTGTATTAESSSAASVPMAEPSSTPMAGSTAGGLVRNGAGAQSAASGGATCTTAGLQADLAAAVRSGASVIVGYGTLASGATAVPGTASRATVYYSVTLQSVRTLAGPAVTSGSVAWIAGASPAVSAGPSASSGTGSATAQARALPPGTELFGIVSSSGAPGPVLKAAPVVSGQVLLSAAGCWNVTVPASGRMIFGPDVPSGSAPTALGKEDITEIPLTTAEKLASQAG